MSFKSLTEASREQLKDKRCRKTLIQPSCELCFKPQGPAVSSPCPLSRRWPGCQAGEGLRRESRTAPTTAALRHPSDLFLPKSGNQSRDTLFPPYPSHEPSTSAQKAPAGALPSAAFLEAVTSCRDPRQHQERCEERRVCTSLLPNSYCCAAHSPSPKIRLPNTSAPVTRRCFLHLGYFITPDGSERFPGRTQGFWAP